MTADPTRSAHRLKVLATASLLVAFLADATVSRGAEAPLLGTDLKLGRCEAGKTFVLALHGGTVRHSRPFPGSRAIMEGILTEGRAALAGGAKALDVVHAAVRAMEDSGLFNAGRGAFANQAGVVELVGVLGYYGLVSMTLNVFEVEAPGPGLPPLD